MHAYLIICNKININININNLVEKLNSKPIEYDLHKIEEVRELKKFTKLSLGEKTVIIAKNINKSSTEAQNALLKIIEEPQVNLKFILTSDAIQNVLPTIISRCQLIEINKYIKADIKIIKNADNFFNKNTGEQLLVTSKISAREDAVKFLEELLIGGHSLMLKNNKLANNLENIQTTLNNIKLNGNVQLQLTNMVVKITLI